MYNALLNLSIRDSTDGTVRNFDLVQFAHVAFNIIRGHSLDIHGDNLFFHMLSDGILTLFDDLWFISGLGYA